MKKIYFIFCAVILAGFMTACANVGPDAGNTDKTENTLPDYFVVLEDGEWPANEYTDGIPQPESGTVSQSWIDTDNHLCFISMTDVSCETMETWYGSLLDCGFTEVGKIAEEIDGQNYTSTNALLKKDSVYISMAHLSAGDGSLTLSITSEDKD